jgi:hypothetical protein
MASFLGEKGVILVHVSPSEIMVKNAKWHTHTPKKKKKKKGNFNFVDSSHRSNVFNCCYSSMTMPHSMLIVHTWGLCKNLDGMSGPILPSVWTSGNQIITRLFPQTDNTSSCSVME